jgi:hypothetical protein
MQFPGTFTTYLHTEFQSPSSNHSLVITVKLKAKHKFLHGHHVLILHSTKKIPLTKVAYFSKFHYPT